MARQHARGALAGIVGLLLLAGVAGCGTPQPSATAASAVTAAPPSATAGYAEVVVCDSTTSTWTQCDANGSPVPVAITLTCENAIAAARALVGRDLAGPVSIEFHWGGWCPPYARCAASGPNTGHVIFRVKVPGPDILVSVKADEAGKVTASDLLPLPSP